MTEENTVVELDTTPVANLDTTYKNVRAGALVTCTPVDEDSPLAAKTVTVDYVEVQAYKGEEAKPVAYKFCATGVVTVEGMETEVVKYAAKADRAVDMVLDAIFKGVKGIDHTSFANDADWEDEWFQSNMKAPPAVTDNCWVMDKFKDNLEELAAARGEFESHMEASQGNEVTAQFEAIQAAKVLHPIYRDVLGSNRKLMASWAMGPDGQGANMPLLAKLGKGQHALTELMKLATISDALVRILPVSITSGKGAEYHRAKGYAAVAAVASTLPNQVTVVDGKAALPTAEQAALILTNIAVKVFGADDGQTANGLIDSVDTAAASAAVTFTEELGKSVSSYDKPSYERAVMTYGKVSCSNAGEGEYANAWELVDAYTTPQEGTAAMTAVEFEKAYLSTGETGNMLLRHAVKAITTHAETVAKEAVVRDVLKEVENEELSPKELKEVKALDADAFAQNMYRRLAARQDGSGDAEAIYKLVGAYAKQSGLFIVEKKDAA